MDLDFRSKQDVKRKGDKSYTWKTNENFDEIKALPFKEEKRFRERKEYIKMEKSMQNIALRDYEMIFLLSGKLYLKIYLFDPKIVRRISRRINVGKCILNSEIAEVRGRFQ